MNISDPENNDDLSDKDETDDNIDFECEEETSRATTFASSYEYIKVQSQNLIHPKHFIRQSSSIISEQLPATPTGWMALLSLVTSCGLTYELQLQKSLTCPPLVYAQLSSSPSIKDIYEQMTVTPESLLRRPIQPSLLVGTRAYAASTAAYLGGAPAHNDTYGRFREIMTLPMDGATVALDWELPPGVTEEQVRQQIPKPVVLVIHGINNHANFGYVRSMVRACTMRGWIAAGFNMRGCGGLALTTPRGYNAAYTGDIRGVVQQLSARLRGAPLFLVGNSLSASLVTKYLGEEGLCGTLPDCVAGGAALGNPVSIDSRHMSLIFSPLLALGVKKSILEQWSALQQIKEPYFLSCIRRAMLAVTLAEFDSAMAPIMIRNDPVYPFSARVGFKNGHSYWNDASSYRLIRFVSVPMMQLIASDDFLVYKAFQGRLAYCLANPNVMIVESKCGGHLGWHEAPPRNYGLGKSWADAATTEFIDVVFKSFEKRKSNKPGGLEFKERDTVLSATVPRSKL